LDSREKALHFFYNFRGIQSRPKAAGKKIRSVPARKRRNFSETRGTKSSFCVLWGGLRDSGEKGFWSRGGGDLGEARFFREIFPAHGETPAFGFHQFTGKKTVLFCKTGGNCTGAGEGGKKKKNSAASGAAKKKKEKKKKKAPGR